MEPLQNSSWRDRAPTAVKAVLIIIGVWPVIAGALFGAQNGGGFACH
jgi:nitrate reductase NapE component